MSTEKIGQAAGAVWSKLHTKAGRGHSFTELKKLPGFSGDEVMAGVGWLAREGKLFFKTEGKKILVTLVEEEMFAGV